MIIRNLSKSKQLLIPKKPTFTHFTSYPMSSITQWMRKFMNRIKFQDNRAIEAKEDKITLQIHQTPKEVEENFIDNQRFKSLVEKERMQKIDQIIGTKTYFHETKSYQERIDSDHVMVIDELQKKNSQPKRKDLNWQNPQAPQQYKVKSTRKFFKKIKNLRQYPKHNYRIVDFNDQQSQQNIQFLGKQSLYSKLSLKWVDTTQKSLESQTIHDISNQLQSHRQSPLHVYFSAPHIPSQIHRISHQYYTPELLNSVTKFTQLEKHIQGVITLDEIYDVLKEYFHDERVNEWLRKVQNGDIGYLLSGYEVSKDESRIVIWVDLLGDKKEYVHLYKNLAKRQNQQQKVMISKMPKDKVSQIQKNSLENEELKSIQTSSANPLVIQKSNVLFNCKPIISFSHSTSIFMIQRSQQGAYVELVKVPIQDATDSFGNPEFVYKCKPFEQMEIMNDESLGYVFVKVKEVGKATGERVMIVEEDDQGKVELVEVVLNSISQDNSNNELSSESVSKSTEQRQRKTTQHPVSRMSLISSSHGLIVTEFHPTDNQYFKYGPSKQYAKRVTIIPYKSHIQLLQESSSKLQKQFQLSSRITKTQRKRPSAKQFDFLNRRILFTCPGQQFITQVSPRSTHLILSLSTHSIYSKKRLHFLPYEPSKNPHSLIFNAQNLALTHFGYSHDSQLVNFSINRSIVFNEYYQYLVWKKELKEMTDDGVHIEKLKVSNGVEIVITVMSRYLGLLPKWFIDKNDDSNSQYSDSVQNKMYKLENSQVPILIYMTDSKTFTQKNQPTTQSQTKSQIHLKKFLQKGTIVITVSCRGTLSSDLITFFNGSGEHFPNMLQDFEKTIEWIGNNLGTNISLYAKGPISSLAGMMLNVKHPFLLTSTVLHDGVYELLDKGLVYGQLDYFVRCGEAQRGSEKFMKFWRRFNPASFMFKKSKIMTKQIIQEQMKEKQEIEKKYQSQLQADQEEKAQGEAKDEKQRKQNQLKTSTTSQITQAESSSLLQIGTLQNLVICCSQSNFAKNQARRMIYRLRQNRNFNYEEVYLKEFLIHEDEELFNLAYIWGKMRDRLEEDNQS